MTLIQALLVGLLFAMAVTGGHVVGRLDEILAELRKLNGSGDPR